MAVETSASVAVLNMEPESARLAAAMEGDANRLISAATVVEAGVVIESRYGSAGGRELDLFIVKASLSIEADTAQHAEVAREAWRRYGKGRSPRYPVDSTGRHGCSRDQAASPPA